MMRYLVLGISILLCALSPTVAQENLMLSLEEAMIIARTSSVDAAVALNKLRTAYWEHRTYRAELLPELSFNATVPGYFKQYSSYQNSDGNYSFVRNNYIELSGELAVTQNIWFTGGSLSLITSFDFLRQLDGERYNRFLSIPIALTLNQPVFGVNNIKWKRKIEPVKYDEAKAEFLSATEDLAIEAITHYFNLIMAQENLNTARQNLENAAKLHEIAIEKRKMGRISQNDLLQMELNELNAQSTLTDCESNQKNYMFRLRSFLGLPDNVEIHPIIPQDVPSINVSYNDALERALTYNKFSKNLLRRQLEADYAVAQAKGDLRQINLYAQIGYTGTGSQFRRAYDPLKDNQIVEIGMKIPILDWGKRRGKVKVAESNRDLVESSIRQDAQNFNQDLFILVERFANQQEQVEIARRIDTIANKRYNTNVETFIIGKISTLDLSDSQNSKDSARQQLVNELYLYWLYYYQLRSLTLWDYTKNRSIDVDIDALLRYNGPRDN